PGRAAADPLRPQGPARRGRVRCAAGRDAGIPGSRVMSVLDSFFFGIYPYVCLTVFFVGSLVRFDRDQYTWKSDSSQMLRAGPLRWGSNLFHIGVLFLFFGHFVGMLTPHFVYEPFIGAGAK